MSIINAKRALVSALGDGYRVLSLVMRANGAAGGNDFTATIEHQGERVERTWLAPGKSDPLTQMSAFASFIKGGN